MENQRLHDTLVNDLQIELNMLKLERMIEPNQLKKNDLTKRIQAIREQLENEYGSLYNSD